MTIEKILHIDCLEYFQQYSNDEKFSCTFLDPPFNQDKAYDNHNDHMNPDEYWDWIELICKHIYIRSQDGGCLYFMHREKNLEKILQILSKTGWKYQNLIIWKKMTSAVPNINRFGLHYQIIIFVTKGEHPCVFNKLRIDLPLKSNQKINREKGVFLTDVWDDIRELTSGFFAGAEALRDEKTGKRIHNQQTPIALILRIILSSSNINDVIFDPFSGTGTTAIVAKQLQRNYICLEKSNKNYQLILDRLNEHRECDKIDTFISYYRFTDNLDNIWKSNKKVLKLDSFITHN